MHRTFAVTAGVGLSLLLVGPLAAAPPGDHQPNRSTQTVPSPTAWKLERFLLVVQVDVDSGFLAGTATLTLRNTGKAPIRDVPLLLNRLMRVRAVSLPNGRAIPHRQDIATFADVGQWQVNAIRAVFPRAIAPGDSTTLAIHYDGYLVGYTEVGMEYVRDRIGPEFSMLREDALAFPTVGVLSFESNRKAPRGPFAAEALVTVRSDQVVAGGVLRESASPDSLRTWHLTYPGPTPFLNIAIAPYRLYAADNLRVYAFETDSLGGEQLFTAAQRALERLQAWFGPVETQQPVVVVEIPEGWGSQASLTGGIIQDAAAFRDRSAFRQLYHELSHLWNPRDLDTPSSRWNEGLAMYLQGRLARELDGWSGEGEAWERAASQLLRECGAAVPCDTVPFAKYGDARLEAYAYTTGVLLFARLHAALGDATFDQGLHAFWERYREHGAHLNDLREVFLSVGGEAARQVLDDWMDSTRWYSHLRRAGSFRALLAGH
jgi:hypothetical protein